jgi:hypothetical protein
VTPSIAAPHLKEEPMDFNETQKDILYRAWLLARRGNGQVVTDEAIPDAHALAEAGWLERRFEPDGDMSWWWTSQGETALELGALTTGHSPN